MSPIDALLPRLEGLRGASPKWSAKCPAHEDRSPSLSIKTLDDGRVLIHCHAGCSAIDVLTAIGLSLKDLYPGPMGELSGKPWRKNENRLYRSGYDIMQNEIYKLRARLSAK
jgi:putative DNA primase/helicase